MDNRLEAINTYNARKLRLAKLGLLIAWFSSLSFVGFQNVNVAATTDLYSNFDEKLMTIYLVTLISVGICEFSGGIMMIIYNSFTGVPLKEYKRVWNFKSSRFVLISAFSAGPIGNACVIAGIGLCGSTYGNIIVALTPIVIAIAGRIFLKENTNARVYLGIALAVAGAIIASYTAPEGVQNFYLGIAVTLIAPVAWTVEAMLSTRIMDVSDPLEVCGLYRMVGGGLLGMGFAVILMVIMGKMAMFVETLRLIVSDNYILFLFFLTALFMAIEYGTNYVAYNYCGAVRGAAVLFSTPIWSIPLGYMFAAVGILPYVLNIQGVIGAVVVVAGVVLVLAKPSELFSFRNL